VPYSNVLEVARFKEPDVLVTSLVAAMSVPDAEAYVRQLAADFPSKTLYITGSQAFQLAEPLPSNVTRISDPLQFKSLITPPA